ncbi:hypothetical protein HJFPF1_07207 [Paramyrothecium foliicola]|nr:hypothetical protein HJFPF1_07207 [Paramyrothecium foliicola]
MNLILPQHDTKWINGWMQGPALTCQRDEYPPAVIWQARDLNVFIRFSPGGTNMGAGSLFSGFCSSYIHTGTRTRQVTLQVFSLKFDNMPDVLLKDGLEENPCWPKVLGRNDPSFALLNDDPWYDRPGNANLKAIVDDYSKRDSGYIVDKGNSSLPLSDEELLENYGLLRCEADDCRREMEVLGLSSLPVVDERSDIHGTTPKTAEAGPTTVVTTTATATETSKADSPALTTEPEAVAAVESPLYTSITGVRRAVETMARYAVDAAFYDYDEELEDEHDCSTATWN